MFELIYFSFIHLIMQWIYEYYTCLFTCITCLLHLYNSYYCFNYYLKFFKYNRCKIQVINLDISNN